MRRASAGTTIGLALCCAVAPRAAVAASFTPPQRDYILACAGCHGVDGLSHSRMVPDLKGRVGYYLNTPEGRAYLLRLPNVAFSTLDDARLASVLNYVAFGLGEGSAPPHAPRYAAMEVARWRRQPLTEVALLTYRAQIVGTLVERYHAPAELRGYATVPAP